MILFRLNPTTFSALISLIVLSNLMAEISSQTVINQCNSDMKFCDDTGYFDPVINQKLFEGSIALFQSAFFNTLEEKRMSFLQPNPT